jgi:hypothetical protein
LTEAYFLRGFCYCHRSAFLLCIGFNIILQTAAQTLGEERIEIMVDALLKGGLPMAMAMFQ